MIYTDPQVFQNQNRAKIVTPTKEENLMKNLEIIL